SRLVFTPATRWAAATSVFFFQAEDGIRDLTVTGVQTCALPIWSCLLRKGDRRRGFGGLPSQPSDRPSGEGMTGKYEMTHLSNLEIGRASCRERGESSRVEHSAKVNNDDCPCVASAAIHDVRRRV